MSSTRINLEQYLIPLEEIVLATNNFSSEAEIGSGGASVIFGGELSERWGNRKAAFKRLHPRPPFFGQPEFLNMVVMMSSFNHENIIGFIGYCDEANDMIIVSEYANNQSLYEHIDEPDKRRSLTWAQRLKICLGAAAGLEYLHSGLGEGHLVLHKNIKSQKVLLDHNLEAKICSFNLSILVDPNQPYFDEEMVVGTPSYIDPLYNEGANTKIESDVYSFGVVLFEVLSGMFAYQKRSVGDNRPQSLINLVRRYYDDGLDNLIDTHIRDHINIRSFRAFKKIAYQCISWNLKDRPTMSMIIRRIQEALDIQNDEAASTYTLPSYQHQNLESFVIPLEEIHLATQNFSEQRFIGGGRSHRVYKGELSEKWQNHTTAIKRLLDLSDVKKDEFRNEVKMASSFQHKNIIGFIGYCDEANEMITVYEYAINRSVYQQLQKPGFDKRDYLTWAQRLQICIEAARGLEYFHSGQWEGNRIIHRDIYTSHILLDDNLVAKISNFGLSVLVDRINQPQVYDLPYRTESYYIDPIYLESGLVNTQSDIYSFGVVMLEMLSGTEAYKRRTIGDDAPQRLVHVVRHYYHEGLDMLIDPVIEDQINIHSFHAFIKIVYRCVSLNLEDRPTMKKIIKQLEEARYLQNQEAPSAIITRSAQHQNLEQFRIPLEEINLAIKDFNQETPIGDGGYGKVYEARLSEQWRNCRVAIKCLDPEGHQGKKEFLNEVKLISSFHHPNIIPFVGYCDEGDQMIIVSKYAINGSLDYHLQDPRKREQLTWAQRLKICLGAAKGLDYLHSGLGKDKKVIHRDVKSANILLDENMEAEICDFGLSKQGPRNEQDTQIYTQVAGTNFYLDPLYRESSVLTKESDVYSFGVVLFEILSGILAYGRQPLMSLVRRHYKHEPEKLIDPIIRDEIDNHCLQTFRELAYKCISLNSGERPTMDRIIDTIDDAIDFQEHEV